MTTQSNVCPTCGRPHKGGNKYVVPVIAGGIIGFLIGTGFVAFWFGTEAGFTHNMALIHEVSGTVLGLFGGLIVAALRK